MHDIRELDSRGTPGGYIASEVFRGAAQSQGDALGFHPDSLFVAHPIQDRTDAELRELAEQHFDAIVALLLKGNAGA